MLSNFPFQRTFFQVVHVVMEEGCSRFVLEKVWCGKKLSKVLKLEKLLKKKHAFSLTLVDSF